MQGRACNKFRSVLYVFGCLGSGTRGLRLAASNPTLGRTGKYLKDYIVSLLTIKTGVYLRQRPALTMPWFRGFIKWHLQIRTARLWVSSLILSQMSSLVGQTGRFLQLCLLSSAGLNVITTSPAHGSMYSLLALSGATISQFSNTPNPSPSQAPSSNHDRKSPVAAVVGGVVGSILALAVCAAVLLAYRLRKALKRTQQNNPSLRLPVRSVKRKPGEGQSSRTPLTVPMLKIAQMTFARSHQRKRMVVMKRHLQRTYQSNDVRDETRWN